MGKKTAGDEEAAPLMDFLIAQNPSEHKDWYFYCFNGSHLRS